jgi:TRAP-type C4-dicarboxylate transport system permease small subunit
MLNESIATKMHKIINKVVEVTSVTVLAILTFVVFYSVLLRYAFKSPLAWSEEIARYLFIWLIFLGISVAEQYGEHFKIELFIEMVPPKVRIVIEIVLNSLIFYALYILFREGINYYNQGKGGLSTITQMPLSYVYLALPVATVLTFLNRIGTMHKTIITLFIKIKEDKLAVQKEQQKGVVQQ